MAVMFDLTVTQTTPTSKGIHTSPTMLLDPENVGVHCDSVAGTY